MTTISGSEARGAATRGTPGRGPAAPAAAIGDRPAAGGALLRLRGELAEHAGPCIVAFGTFDGVHAGHRRVLAEAAAWARAERRETTSASVSTRHSTPSGVSASRSACAVTMTTCGPRPSSAARRTPEG